MGRKVRFNFSQASRELARRTPVILIEEMVESNRDLDESLQEEPIVAQGSMPKIFERIVAFKIVTIIKFLNATQKLIIAHQLRR